MDNTPALTWLPEPTDWRGRLDRFRTSGTPDWSEAVALAGFRIDFTRTKALDAAVARSFPDGPGPAESIAPVRLAILGSSTTAHLAAAIRVAGLRRGLWIATHEPDYGQYERVLADPGSALHAFAPTAMLVALDARHVTAGLTSSTSLEAWLDAESRRLEAVVAAARTLCGGPVLVQALLPVFPSLLGENEHRHTASPATAVGAFNGVLRALADRSGADVLALDARAARDGVSGWHDPALWHHAKQEVAPAAAPVYGDLVARVLAARLGRSAKCLVLDLDNTLWGGVVGDDGTDRLVLGQGSALGEGFLAVQAYARALGRRGVILAVCSKNDEANALEPFDRHPDMLLHRADIACFMANWDDKAQNLRRIAATLNIGLDALVFVDDNPFERDLVRTELPMVAVPEVPDDPALVPQRLADAGYFESVGLTADDLRRTESYRANQARTEAKATVTDLPAYLRGLDMRLVWSRFDPVGLPRIVQLVNKTNQFNLTTRRRSEAEVRALMIDPDYLALQLRLTDRFGDNGMISVVIGRREGSDLVIDTWLMSCRVLGRGVETATLAVLAAEAQARGVARLIGEFRPSPKNAMVISHYPDLGFSALGREPEGTTRWALDLATFTPAPAFMTIEDASA